MGILRIAIRERHAGSRSGDRAHSLRVRALVRHDNGVECGVESDEPELHFRAVPARRDGDEAGHAVAVRAARPGERRGRIAVARAGEEAERLERADLRGRERVDGLALGAGRRAGQYEECSSGDQREEHGGLLTRRAVDECFYSGG